MTIRDQIGTYFSHNRPPVHVHLDALTVLDYDYIDDGIYIGTNQCCTVGLADVLQKEGIQSDISLEAARLDEPYGVSEYIWIPTPDHGIPTRAQLEFGIATLEHLVASGRKVYLHCQHGHGRSSTFVSAYLMRVRNYTPETALAFIRERRPGAHLQDVQLAFLKTIA